MIISMPITFPIEGMSILSENDGKEENNKQDETFEGRFVATTTGVSGINLNWQLDDIWLSMENAEQGKELYKKNIDNFKEKMTKSFENKLEESRYGDEVFYKKYRDFNSRNDGRSL